MTKDPVCCMEVKIEAAQNKLNYEGKTYYFCTPLCMVTFQNAPEKYLNRPKSKSE